MEFLIVFADLDVWQFSFQFFMEYLELFYSVQIYFYVCESSTLFLILTFIENCIQ